MSDEQKRIRIAIACGWRHEHSEDHDAFYSPDGITHGWQNGGAFGRIAKAMEAAKVPDYLSDLNAAFSICDAVSDRFDVVIRKHNNHHWRVEFCEPSNEYSASHESLATAICVAFLAVLGPAQQP